MWILVDNDRSRLRIGVIYTSQENVTSNNELKIMYNNIIKQISIAQEERQQVLILGDFHTKVTTYIKDTNIDKREETIDESGKKLGFGNKKQRKGSL